MQNRSTLAKDVVLANEYNKMRGKEVEGIFEKVIMTDQGIQVSWVRKEKTSRW